MTGRKIEVFRLGIYVFEDAEVVDFAAPYRVFSVARRYDPALDVFLAAQTLRPVQAQARFTVLPASHSSTTSSGSLSTRRPTRRTATTERRQISKRLSRPAHRAALHPCVSISFGETAVRIYA
jgi:hypothetical protein